MRHFLGDPGPENRGAKATHVSFEDRDNLTEPEKRFLEQLTIHEEALVAQGIQVLNRGYAVRFNRRISMESIDRFIEKGPPLVVDDPEPETNIEDAQTIRPDPNIL